MGKSPHRIRTFLLSAILPVFSRIACTCSFEGFLQFVSKCHPRSGTPAGTICFLSKPLLDYSLYPLGSFLLEPQTPNAVGVASGCSSNCVFVVSATSPVRFNPLRWCRLFPISISKVVSFSRRYTSHLQ